MRQNVSSGGEFEPIMGYSRAVRVGNQVHVSGTTARAPEVDGDAYVQSVAVLDIIEKALSEAGASMSDVVRTVVYVTDMGDAQSVARAHGERFGDIRPASTLVEVTALLKPEMKVEIEAYAILTD
jgi:enamine deaminase RidA (YjgF/YER057c/UK114 family)